MRSFYDYLDVKMMRSLGWNATLEEERLARAAVTISVAIGQECFLKRRGGEAAVSVTTRAGEVQIPENVITSDVCTT